MQEYSSQILKMSYGSKIALVSQRFSAGLNTAFSKRVPGVAIYSEGALRTLKFFGKVIFIKAPYFVSIKLFAKRRSSVADVNPLLSRIVSISRFFFGFRFTPLYVTSSCSSGLEVLI